MTVEEYYSAIRLLGLTRTNISTVYRDFEGIMYNVKNPNDLTSAQRKEYIDMLKFSLNVGPRPF